MFPYVALWSGSCGAIASSFAKLAFSRERLLHDVIRFVSIVLWNTTEDENNNHTHDGGSFLSSLSLSSLSSSSSDWLELILRLIFLLAMIACNVIAVGTFIQGMEESGSVKGTALTTAANSIVSTVLGIVLWKDQVPSQGGLFLVLLGIVILVLPSNNINTDGDNKTGYGSLHVDGDQTMKSDQKTECDKKTEPEASSKTTETIASSDIKSTKWE